MNYDLLAVRDGAEKQAAVKSLASWLLKYSDVMDFDNASFRDAESLAKDLVEEALKDVPRTTADETRVPLSGTGVRFTINPPYTKEDGNLAGSMSMTMDAGEFTSGDDKHSVYSVLGAPTGINYKGYQIHLLPTAADFAQAIKRVDDLILEGMKTW